ncbi:uncharacterized protein LOC128257307 isoform X2 [Drosophila gunungcola]|uniref:uncharacterized protein LOC128257307 isoform X2 n=1 Tax=Drosophila gunungcola TaxID=103775 RepID=UPI0022DF1F1D|nr:uncharacterized protein LOC128257307 isoform X2 [Drosophila gunungcola]
MGNPTNILDLPLEILDRILDELSFKDKLKLAQADQDLQSAFAYHCRNEYKKISSRTLSLENWSDFLMVYGPNVDEINVDSLDVQYLKLIEQHCCNLKIISGFYLKDHKCTAAKSLISALKSLTSMEITITNDNTAEVIHILQEVPNLKILSIQFLGETYDESGVLKQPSSLEKAHIHKLINLEDLTIRSTFGHSAIKIEELSSHLKMLRKLNLSGVKFGSAPENMELNFPALEELSISDSHIDVELPYCPKLCSLRVFNLQYSSSNFFVKWMVNHINTLESFESDSGVFKKNVLFSIFSSNSFGEWKFPEIKHLVIRNSKIWFPLPFCPKLISLEFSSTTFFSMNFFFKWISKHGTTLQKLSISFELFKEKCRLTKLSKIQSQTWILPALKDLNITFNTISYDLPYCPNLVSLSLEYAKCRSMDYFYKWILRHSNNLQSLKLREELFEENKLLEFLSKCNKIHKLEISDKTISFEFMNSLVNILRENGVTSKNPFEITISHNEFLNIQLG